MAIGVGPPASGQLVTDTYAVQHPGVPERRAIQSVCVHLISICAFLERDWPAERAADLIRRALARPSPRRWLDPVLPLGRLTVDDVALPPHAAGRGRLAVRWAEDLWACRAEHHDEVRRWLAAILG